MLGWFQPFNRFAPFKSFKSSNGLVLRVFEFYLEH